MPEAGKVSVRQHLQGREGTAEGEGGWSQAWRGWRGAGQRAIMNVEMVSPRSGLDKE